MKKHIKKVVYPLLSLLLLSAMTIKAMAVPLTFNLSSEIGEFDYLGDTYGVKIITSANSGDITYCLEINDDYPKSNHEYSSL
ncbi:MAG: hypothetical protein ACRC7N_12395, partial [Clostridium sp.]